MLTLTKPIVFVETSVQIARVLGEKSQVAQIEQTLRRADCTFVSSHYVYMEYQRTLVSDFAYVHNAFRRAHSLGEAMRLIFAGPRTFRPRSLTRCGQIAGLVYGEREVVHLADATALLDLYLQRLLRRIFWQQVTPVDDPIRCDLVATGTMQQVDGHYTVADTCQRATAACALPQYLTTQRSRLQDLVDYLALHPKVIKEQTRVEALLTAVLADPRAVLGQATCWPLGDLIIALQVPAGGAIWTLDSDFAALATALSLQTFTSA
jgi:hypothetical protein